MKYYLFSVRDLILTNFFYSCLHLVHFFLLEETVYYKCARVHNNSSASQYMYYNVVKFTYFFSASYNSDLMFSFSVVVVVASPSHFGLTLLLYFWCWCKHWNIAVLRKYDRWSRNTRERIRQRRWRWLWLCRRASTTDRQILIIFFSMFELCGVFFLFSNSVSYC